MIGLNIWKQKFKSKALLEKSIKYKKYISQIDKLVENTSNEKLKSFFEKVNKMENKNDLIKYLESKIYEKLSK